MVVNDPLTAEFPVLSGDIFSADSDIFYSTDSDIFGADLDLLPASVEADSTDSFCVIGWCEFGTWRRRFSDPPHGGGCTLYN